MVSITIISSHLQYNRYRYGRQIGDCAVYCGGMAGIGERVREVGWLLVVSLMVFALSVGLAVYEGGDLMRWMELFIGVFFSVFGILKAVKLREFVKAYRMYDIVAARVLPYGYVYPFIEIALGAAYLAGIVSATLHLAVALIMLIGALGVYRALQRKERLMCACLGAVFRVPMTKVTLFENLLMAAMAFSMALWIVPIG